MIRSNSAFRCHLSVALIYNVWFFVVLHIPVFFTWKAGGEGDWMSKNCWKETTPCNFCYGLTILDYIYTKNILPFLKFKPYWQTQFHYRHWNLWWLLPTSAVWTVLNDLIWFDYCTIDSSHELQRAAEHLIDSTKKTFVSWVMNFTVHMLLKGAVTYCDQHFMPNFSFYFLFLR